MLEITETKDYRLLAELNEEIQTLHHSLQSNIFKPFDREAVEVFFKSVVKTENAMAYLAQENGTSCGYVLLFKMNFPDNPFQYARSFVLIDQIVVLEKHRGKGIGTRLLDAALSFAKENKIDVVELNHWTENDSARTFFGKHHFEYYNEKMWRSINP